MTIILLQFTKKILYFTDRELKAITTSRRDEHNPNVVQCPIRMDNPAPLQLVRIFDQFQSWGKNRYTPTDFQPGCCAASIPRTILYRLAGLPEVRTQFSPNSILLFLECFWLQFLFVCFDSWGFFSFLWFHLLGNEEERKQNSQITGPKRIRFSLVEAQKLTLRQTYCLCTH